MATAGEVFIRASRTRALIFAPLSLGMALASADMATTAPSWVERGIGWVGAVFFGAGVLLFLWQALSPDRFGLRLTGEGFELLAAARTVRYRWADVRDFQVVRLILYRRVGFNFTAAARRGGVVSVGRAMSGVDQTLPLMLSITPDELVRLMETWRQTASGGGPFGAAERS